MKILFHLGHPAHYHLFKNTIKKLENSHSIFVLIKKKDILENLLIEDNIPYLNILPSGRKDSKIGLLYGLVKSDLEIYKFCVRNKPDILVGTSPNITHVSKLLKIPSLNFNEDDADVVPLYAKLSYPFSTEILTPISCDNGKWEKKSIKYDSYHELAYLHPNNFSPSSELISNYINISKSYFILRFASLTAHHDKGIRGFNEKFINKIISLLSEFGDIYITSEKTLPTKLEKYRLNLPASLIHHALFYSSLYIGDSQTMAAEAAVLGIPSFRYNDFVGRLGYLNELEKKYKLTFGFKPGNENRLLSLIINFAKNQKVKNIWKIKRNKMLSEKIDLNKFIIWFINNYPNSAKIIKENSHYQYKFK